MATVRAIALVASVLLLSAASEVSPAGARDGLAGTTWHTERIDGQQKSRTGSYRVVKAGTLLVAIDGLGKPKELRFRRQRKDLVVQDRAYDVTARLAPGKMEEERWF